MHICSEEGINLEREAAQVIAGLSDGAMRDALSLLESCASKGGFITSEYVINLLGLSNREQLIELLYSCSKQNTIRAITIVNELYEKNGDISACFFELLSLCRDALIIKNVASPSRFINASEAEIKRLTEIADSVSNDTINYFIEELKNFINSPDVFGVNKKVTAEIAVIKMTSPSSVLTIDSLSDRISRLEESVKNGDVVAPRVKKEKVTKKDEQEEKKALTPQNKIAESNKEIFEHVSEFIRKYGEKEPMNKFFLEAAKIKLVGRELIIYTNSFSANMLKSESSIASALSVAKEIDDNIVSVKVVDDSSADEDKIDNNSDLDNL